jgi:hypothetical protein
MKAIASSRNESSLLRFEMRVALVLGDASIDSPVKQAEVDRRTAETNRKQPNGGEPIPKARQPESNEDGADVSPRSKFRES